MEFAQSPVRKCSHVAKTKVARPSKKLGKCQTIASSGHTCRDMPRPQRCSSSHCSSDRRLAQPIGDASCHQRSEKARTALQEPPPQNELGGTATGRRQELRQQQMAPMARSWTRSPPGRRSRPPRPISPGPGRCWPTDRRLLRYVSCCLRAMLKAPEKRRGLCAALHGRRLSRLERHSTLRHSCSSLSESEVRCSHLVVINNCLNVWRYRPSGGCGHHPHPAWPRYSKGSGQVMRICLQGAAPAPALSAAASAAAADPSSMTRAAAAQTAATLSGASWGHGRLSKDRHAILIIAMLARLSGSAMAST